MKQFSKYGLQYKENGFDIIPIKPGLKWPGEKTWQSKDYEPHLNTGQYEDYGIGFRTANTPVIDADILNPILAAQFKQYLFDKFGYSPVRYGQRPKFAYLCRLDPDQEVFYKTVSATFEDEAGVQQKVEILGHGQQLVAAHRHPDTGTDYEWEGDSPLYISADTLPIMNDDIAESIIADFELAAELSGFTKIAEGGQAAATRDLFSDRSNAMFATIDDDILNGLELNGCGLKQQRPGRYELNRCLFSDGHTKTKGGAFYCVPGIDGNPEALYKCNHASCASKTAKDVAEALGVPVPRRLGDFELFSRLTAKFTASPDMDLNEPLLPMLQVRAIEAVTEAKKNTVIELRPDLYGSAFLFDEPVEDIRWLIPDIIIANQISMLAAAGGSGKSFLMLYMALCVASGAPFFGFPVPAAASVLYVSAEDDKEIVKRRIRAVASGMDMTFEQQVLMRENLHLWDREGKDSRLILPNQQGVMGASEFSDEVVEYIIDREAQLTLMDPLSMFNGGSENKAEDMNVLIQVFRAFKQVTHPFFAHHVNKGSIMAGKDANQAAARGSSALTDGVRMQLQLNALSDKELQRYGILEDDRRNFTRLHMPKANYSGGMTDIYLKRSDGGVLVPASLVSEDAVERCNDAVLKQIIYLDSKKVFVSKRALMREYKKDIVATEKEVAASVDILISEGKLEVIGSTKTSHLRVK